MPTQRQTPAARIARAILSNCDAYNDKRIDRDTWNAEQLRLWKLAADRHCQRAVMRVLFPAPTQRSLS